MIKSEVLRKSRFTLIELLVVIAIIAILAGILMPALSQARQRGKDSTCVSNLKALSAAVQAYTDGNNDYFPMWYNHWESHWVYMLQVKKYFSTGIGNTSTVYTVSSAAQAQLPRGVLNCPAAPELPLDSYGYRGTHFSLNELTYYKANTASALGEAFKRGKAPGRHPSEHLMLMDNNRENGSKSDASKASPWYANNSTFRYVEGVEATGTGDTPLTGNLRHRGGMVSNVAYWDGHVGQVNPAAGKHKTRYYYANNGTRFFNPTK